MCATLWSLKTYDKIVVRLKTIKDKIDIIYYLSSLPSSLAIEPNHQAHWSMLTS